jgi:cation transport ATPase
MTIKLSLDTEALIHLLSDNPELELQFKTLAAEQVAEILKRKLFKHPQVFQDQVNLVFQQAIVTYRNTLSTRVTELIHEEARLSVRRAMNTMFEEVPISQEEINKRINASVDRSLAKAELSILNTLEQRIDMLLSKKISSLFHATRSQN